MRYRLFQKTGCFLTADGSDYNLVQPEGLPDYQIPSPSFFDPAPATPVNVPPPPLSSQEEQTDQDIKVDGFEGKDEDFEVFGDEDDSDEMLMAIYLIFNTVLNFIM